jgi:hypothetical protein
VTVDAGYVRGMGDMTYEYAAVLEFEDERALRAYLQHPLHHELGRLFWENCERTVVSEVEFLDGRDPDLVHFLTGRLS